MYFDELDLNDDILDALDAMNFSECTPIQEQAIPPLLEGHDLIGVAQTGTGKTAAYLLPILSRISDGGFPEGAINCLIMSPTRELAQQIDQAMQGFSYYVNVSSVAVYGGNDGIRFAQECRGFDMGADVVIATPGRLISHIALGNVDLSKVSFFVLDEADRMLDMGFVDDIKQIVKQLPAERQTLLFSATMPAEIQQLASAILRDPVEIKLAVSKPAEKIVQSAYICHETQKLGIVQHLFAESKPQRVILFSSSKLKVKEIARSLKRIGERNGFVVGEMHSDLTQTERDTVMHEFKAGRVNILVATDIVARGIDIDDIQLVINYDVPHDCEDYVHRIGRTARAGSDGAAITFVSVDEQARFRQIEKFIGREVDKTPVPAELGEAPDYAPHAFNKSRSRHRSKQKGGAPSGAPSGAPKGGEKGAGRKRNKGRKSQTDANDKAAGPSSAKANAPKDVDPNAKSPENITASANPDGGEQAKKKKRHKHRRKPAAGSQNGNPESGPSTPQTETSQG